MTYSALFNFNTLQEQIDFLNKLNTPAPAPVPVPGPTPVPSGPLFLDPFSYPDGLVTNEYAFWNPTDPSAKKSANWEMTSGSLFAKGGMGWTGIPNGGNPDNISSTGNNSCIFRMVTKRKDFTNVAVSLKLQHNGLVTGSTTPAVDWDGIHVFLRYVSEESLYYASINRRDNKCILKKKVPGGPSNGGTYYDLTPGASHTVPLNTVQNVKATIVTKSDSTVTINLYAEGALLLSGTDKGIGGPIILAGGVGLRGDNCNFQFDDFKVESV